MIDDRLYDSLSVSVPLSLRYIDQTKYQQSREQSRVIIFMIDTITIAIALRSTMIDTDSSTRSLTFRVKSLLCSCQQMPLLDLFVNYWLNKGRSCTQMSCLLVLVSILLYSLVLELVLVHQTPHNPNYEQTKQL